MSRLFTFLLALLVALPAAAQTPEEQLAAASALFNEKKFGEAAQRLEGFLAANPKHAKAGPAALALARAYVELRQWARAVPAYEKALATKDAAVVSIAQLGLGEAALYAEQYSRAAAALEAVVRTPLKPDQAPLAWFWLAQAQFRLEKYGPAEEAYVKVTRDFPQSEWVDGAWFGAGLSALRLNKGDLARQRLKTVVERFPKSEDRPQALLLLAQMDLGAKRAKEARTGFEAVLKDPASREDPETLAEAEQGLVAALLELQDYPAAAGRLEAALQRLKPDDPQRARAHLSLGHCRYRQKQFEPALSSYREAAKSTEGAVAGEAHYWAGNAALSLNRHAEAAAEFARVPARFPKHELAAKAQLRTGDALLAVKQEEAASAAYRAVTEKYPQSAEAAEAKKALGQLVFAATDPMKLAASLKTLPAPERAPGTVRLARLYLEAKKFSEAEKALADLPSLQPDPAVRSEGQYLLGVALEGRGGAAERAAAAFGEAVRLQPSAPWTADAQTRLAWVLLDLKKPADAEKAAAAALAGKPEKELERQARLAQVQASLDQERWEAALEGCRQLLAGNPPRETLATVLYTQAWVAGKQGKAAEALPLWEQLVAEHPKSPYAPEARLRLGDARFEAKEYDKARDLYMAFLAAHAQHPLALEARYKLGTVLYNQDRFPEAAAELDRVTAAKEAGDLGAEALYWSGRALEKAGKKPEALQRFTRLVTQYPKHVRTADARLRQAALKAVLGM